MAKPWEFPDLREMLIGLIGFDFGPEPEKHLPEIRQSKKGVAEYIIRQLKLKQDDEVLEVGSGCGFLSHWVAPNVKHLYCCDISESFLGFAKRECTELTNISFHQIYSTELAFLSDQSVDAIYAHAVFIHLNLFDIYWYMSQFSRVLRPAGRIWIDMANAETLKPASDKYFLEMAQYYKEDPKCLSSLMQWNSPQAVMNVADHFDFTANSSMNYGVTELLLSN